MYNNIILPFAFLAALVPGLNVVPELYLEAEKRFFPIINEMEFFEVSRNGDKVLYHVFGKKNRNCTFVQALGFSKQGKWGSEAGFSFIDDVSPNSSRPKGKQDFGLWEFDISNQPRATEVFTVITHDCGFWNVQTTLGPVKIIEGNG